MRVGLVSYWFNRGQATVARQVRAALEARGHTTCVLARPTKDSFMRPGYVAGDDVWDQPGVTRASAFRIPEREYLRWAEDGQLELVLCDQNYQFDEIGALRRRGVRTMGRFVWEAFKEEHVAGARRAFDVVYSVTRCEQARYRRLGIDSPLVPWGCHPDFLAAGPGAGDPERVTYFVAGGYVSPRKPLGAMVRAFADLADPRLRMLVKIQGVYAGSEPDVDAARRSPGVVVHDADEPAGHYRTLMASADVCLAPSRWEGLGLHLYEATALGLPVITNDKPPMDEVVRHEENGLLVGSVAAGRAPSGIPAYDPDPGALAAAIRRLADPGERARLGAGAREAARGRLSWRHTAEALGGLVEALP